MEKLSLGTIGHIDHSCSSVSLAITKYLNERGFNESDAYEYAFCKSFDKGIILRKDAETKQEVLTIGNALFEEITSIKVESNSNKVLQKIKENRI